MEIALPYGTGACHATLAWGRALGTVDVRSAPTLPYDERAIRSDAISRNILLVTTLAAANAMVEGLEAQKTQTPTTKALQDYHRDIVSCRRFGLAEGLLAPQTPPVG